MPLTDEQIDQLDGWIEDGLTTREIADRLRQPFHVVSSHVRERHVTGRDYDMHAARPEEEALVRAVMGTLENPRVWFGARKTA